MLLSSRASQLVLRSIIGVPPAARIVIVELSLLQLTLVGVALVMVKAFAGSPITMVPSAKHPVYLTQNNIRSYYIS
jgi:hypothetical protein